MAKDGDNEISSDYIPLVPASNDEDIEIPDSDGISPATGTINGHEYVDLGLSVKWATCNYGAFSPQEYGDWVNFAASAIAGEDVTARVRLMNAGYGRGDTIAGSIFDSITNEWGKRWRTPTKQEWEELINNSDITRYEYNEILGVKFTSKINGNSIFLPGARCRKWGRDEYFSGYYWTSVLYSIMAAYAYAYM